MKKLVAPTLVLLGLGVSAVVGVDSIYGADDDETTEPVGDVECLRKMALDLTNRGPSGSDVEAVRGGTPLTEIAETYLGSDEFDGIVLNWLKGKYPPTSSTSEDVDVLEPTRISHYLIQSDGDYREVMTGKFSVDANGSRIEIDDRPAAGVLTTQHYMSANVGMLRRVWAAHFLSEWTGIVPAAVTLGEEDDIDTSRDGIAANPLCSNCHFNEVWGIDHVAKFADCYADDGFIDPDCSSESSIFLTESGSSVLDLASIVASSNEFNSQVVNFFFEKTFGRPLAKGEEAFFVHAVRAFVSSGYRVKPLIKHIVTSDAYCAR